MAYASRQPRFVRFLACEEFEARLCLAGVSFSTHDIVASEAGTPRSTFAADLDGDGDVDVLSASFRDGKIAWHENTDGAGTFGPQQVITTEVNRAYSVYASDVDGDGDMDVLSASQYKIAWYENTDGKGTFGPQQVINTKSKGAYSVYAADLDGDGDMDVLSGSSRSVNKVAWYENTDGKGTFGLQQGISTASLGAPSVYAVDVDGDGDIDVVAASSRVDKIAWYENTDGFGTFGPQQVITVFALRPKSVYTADVDGDGDVDVLSASLSTICREQFCNPGTKKPVWYENTDGMGTFGPKQVIISANGGASSVSAADVDGDGDMDILSAAWSEGRNVAWYENTDGAGTFGQEQVIGTKAGVVSAVDVDVDGDGDGDVDVLSMSGAGIFWHENTDGVGTFELRQRITTSFGPMHVADLDGDGDMDVLSASSGDGKIAWYENLSPQIAAGDANRDLQFDQQDIVQVLRGAKYLTGAPATFEQGDWNGDGVFDQLDIVAAVQTENYLQGPYAAGAIDAVFAASGA